MNSGHDRETKRKTLSGIDLDDIAGVGEILTLLLENTPDAIYLLVGSIFPLINTGFQEMYRSRMPKYVWSNPFLDLR